MAKQILPLQDADDVKADKVLQLQHADDSNVHELLLTAFRRSAGWVRGLPGKVPWGLFTVQCTVKGMHYIQNCGSRLDNEHNDRYFIDGMQSLPLGRFMLRVCLLLVHWDRYPHPVDWHRHLHTFDGILILLATNNEAVSKAQVDNTMPGLCYAQRSATWNDEVAMARKKQRIFQEDDDHAWERRMQILESVYEEAAQIYTKDAGLAAGLPCAEADRSWHSLRLSSRLWFVQKQPDLLAASWLRMQDPYTKMATSSPTAPPYWHKLSHCHDRRMNFMEAPEDFKDDS